MNVAVIHKGGYKLALGDLEEMTELQYRSIPWIVATVCSLENGTYERGASEDSTVMTVEELTELRLHGKTPNVKPQDSGIKFYSEPTTVTEWVTSYPIKESSSSDNLSV